MEIKVLSCIISGKNGLNETYTFNDGTSVRGEGDGNGYCEYRHQPSGNMWSSYDLVEDLPEIMKPYAEAMEKYENF